MVGRVISWDPCPSAVWEEGTADWSQAPPTCSGWPLTSLGLRFLVHITGLLVPTSRLRRRRGSEGEDTSPPSAELVLEQILTGAPRGELSLIPKAGAVHTSPQRGVQGCAGKAADAREVPRWGCGQAETPRDLCVRALLASVVELTVE